MNKTPARVPCSETHLQADKGEGDTLPVEVPEQLLEPQHHGVVNAADVGTLQHRAARRGRCGEGAARHAGWGQLQEALARGPTDSEAIGRPTPQQAAGGRVGGTLDNSCLGMAAATSFGEQTGLFSPLNTKPRGGRDGPLGTKTGTSSPGACRQRAPTRCH